MKIADSSLFMRDNEKCTIKEQRGLVFNSQRFTSLNLIKDISKQIYVRKM